MRESHEETGGQYRARMEAELARLEDYENPAAPECEAQYLETDRIRRLLSSLACFASYGTSECAHAMRLEREYCELVSRYNTRLELPAGDDRALARYLLWPKIFVGIPAAVAFLEARDRGLLRKCVNPYEPCGYALFVVGLRCKVGDNSTRTDRKGREHRQFCRTIGRQAISVLGPMPYEGNELRDFMSTIPDLPETYFTARVGKCKGDIRPIGFSQKEQRRVFDLLRASAHRERPRILPEPAPAPPAPPRLAPAPLPVNGDLFEGLLAA